MHREIEKRPEMKSPPPRAMVLLLRIVQSLAVKSKVRTPPPSAAVLLRTTEFVSVSVPKLAMPPPRNPAEFWATTTSLSVSTPTFRIPPPEAEPPGDPPMIVSPLMETTAPAPLT